MKGVDFLYGRARNGSVSVRAIEADVLEAMQEVREREYEIAFRDHPQAVQVLFLQQGEIAGAGAADTLADAFMQAYLDLAVRPKPEPFEDDPDWPFYFEEDLP